MRTPNPGTVLYCEDGEAVVVTPGTTPLDGLITLIKEKHGVTISPDDPSLQDLLPDVRIETWLSCTKAWREEHGQDDGWFDGSGDGKRSITVVYLDGRTTRAFGELITARMVAS